MTMSLSANTGSNGCTMRSSRNGAVTISLARRTTRSRHRSSLVRVSATSPRGSGSAAPAPHKALEITFPELKARHLRLIVTDYRNAPLNIRSATFSAAEREVIFENREGLAGPLRLYYGNPKAVAPHYDFAGNLPATLVPPPQRTQLEGGAIDNPVYRPEPLPLTERLPWLIYVVLGLEPGAAGHPRPARARSDAAPRCRPAGGGVKCNYRQ